MGRLGSRQPAYGPLNTTIPIPDVETWIESLIEIDPQEPATLLTMVQLGRKTGDRYRDVRDQIRHLAIRYLESKSAAPSTLSHSWTKGEVWIARRKLRCSVIRYH